MVRRMRKAQGEEEGEGETKTGRLKEGKKGGGNFTNAKLTNE